MQEIVEKYDTDYCGPYLLPILKYPYDNRSQYKNVLFRTNKYLKEVAKMFSKMDVLLIRNTIMNETD